MFILITRGASPLGLPYTVARGHPLRSPRRSRGSLAAARSLLQLFITRGASPLRLPYTVARGHPLRSPRRSRGSLAAARSLLQLFITRGASPLRLPYTVARGHPLRSPRRSRGSLAAARSLLQLFDVFDFRSEDVEHRLHAGIRERAILERLVPVFAGGPIDGRGAGRRDRHRRAWIRCRRTLGAGHDHLSSGQLARRGLEPRPVLFELDPERAMLRSEDEHDLVAFEIDPLRLRDDGAVEKLLGRTDFRE